MASHQCTDPDQRHLFGNGALTPKAVAARWMARAAEVDLAIIAESISYERGGDVLVAVPKPFSGR